jgi:hypothetical protein
LDTWPLLAWLCSRYLESKKVKGAIRNERMREVCSGLDWSPIWQEHFDAFLEASPLLTTSHVLVEVLGLNRQHSHLYREREQFRSFAVAQLATVEERSVTLKQLRKSSWDDLIVRHGLTDAGVVFLAREPAGHLLIGEDGLLRYLPSDSSFKITDVRYQL